jgi:hypothetical protein
VSDDSPQPRRLRHLEQPVSRPYVFTLERRDGPSGAYRPWAIAVIAMGAASVALRLKTLDGGAHTVVNYPLEPGGAERFFTEDLPQLGLVNAEITRNTPSVFFVLTEIEKQFNIRGMAVFRGRVDIPLGEASTAEERAQRAAEAAFAARSIDMLPTADDAMSR